MKVDLDRLFRFGQYIHAVPVLPRAQMQFVVAADTDGSELGILWLRPRANYPFYLRQSVEHASQRQSITRRVAERVFDGDPTDHIVAIAILRADAPHWACNGIFERRFWWVKSYDAFHGYRPFKNRNGTVTWYDDGGPAEAVLVDTIAPNQPTKGGWLDGDRTKLRPWDGTKPQLHTLL
jgi:hypothetical protein